MFDPILWPELVNHDRKPVSPLSQTTVAKITEAVRSAVAIVSVSEFENLKVIFVSPPCTHFSKAREEDRS